MIVAALAVMVGVSAAVDAHATTVPSGRVYIPVVITDKGITVVSPNPNSGDTGDPRGVIAVFTIVNKGKKPHSFTFLGKTTGEMRPGVRKLFTVFLLARGQFVYRSVFDRGNAFRGIFTVY